MREPFVTIPEVQLPDLDPPYEDAELARLRSKRGRSPR